MELIVNGERTWAYTGGKTFDPTLPCAVFIHGALNDHSVWTLLARWCAHHGWAVLAPDLPAHGRSRGAPLPDVQAHADWLLALLDAAGVRESAYVGHSMGSLIALESAAHAPERATRLVMVGTAYPMKVSPALLQTALDAPLAAIDMVNSFSISTLASKPGYPAPGMWLHGANRALMRRTLRGTPGVNLFHHDFTVCDRYEHGLEAAAQVRCPVHFILGAADQMTNPRVTRGIAQALNARIHSLPCGHALMQEAPEAMLAALRACLA